MSLSKDIRKYDADWSELAERIASGEHIVLPIPSRAAGKDIAFNFYGFREALALHDPDNPWVPAVLACRVSFLDNPPRIVFGKGNAVNTLLAGLRATKRPESTQNTAPPQPVELPRQTQDDALRALGFGVKEEKKP